MEFIRHPASFRDPSGFIFTLNGIVYRQVNSFYKNDFELLHQSGLYNSMMEKSLMLSHQQINENFTVSDHWYTTLLPEQLIYISYPFEWSFDMLKDAALTTLEAAREGLKFRMVLKDASAYNIQLHKGKMMLIDSLSFEKYDGTSPWVAYRQFCEHFLAPLLCMHYLHFPLQQILFAKTEGLSLPLAKKMLPWRSNLNLNILLHLHLHAGFSKRKKSNDYKPVFSHTKLRQLYNSLEEAIRFCKQSLPPTVWSQYYEEAALREDYLKDKKRIIGEWLKKIPAKMAVDIAANDGTFSEMLASQNIFTISVDNDALAINNLYKKICKGGIDNIHPIIMDLANPTPNFGFNNEERISFQQRTKADLVLALAVIHHLAIANNISLELISKFLSTLGNKLIIEFVPKDDPKIKLMLNSRKDVFEQYNESFFLKAFSIHYKIIDSKPLGNSKRKLFLMDLL